MTAGTGDGEGAAGDGGIRLDEANAATAARPERPSDAAAAGSGVEPRDNTEPRANTERRANTDAGANIDAGAPPVEADLVPAASRTQFQSRWNEVQAMFVDEPRNAVDRADALVAEVVQAVTSGFADRKVTLEQRWSSGSDVATEDLRQALRSYRAFFERLLQI